ncbi:MAG: DUF1926 domain-containing protein [Deltaproteobacteria bacterium]|nr:DUF1926 domain-containing protein [Deltaproteobacteria bacterium]
MTYFLFCIHNHQPAGNFDHVLEEAYQSSYWPFLVSLSKYPSIKISLHNSGYLLDWIIENHPEYIELLKAMVKRGQVEIMGGGYYEPVLSVIPEEDRLGQIRMMSDKIEETFGTRPRGIWLAERVWEPTLPTFIKQAGLEYLVVDDYHFIKSGLLREELGGYYITEDQGNVVKVFPGSEALRYLIPFRPTHDLTQHLKGLKRFLRRGTAAIYGDDGEKFGVWPGTHKWVFDEGWLDDFLKTLEANLDWLKVATFAEYLDREEPIGQVYLPTTSYMEMGEWSLLPEASRAYMKLVDEVKTWEGGERVRRFLQGGIWRNFFAKYPEANWMHKRMLYASNAVKDSLLNGNGQAIKKLLYKGQCNDAYWHGVFGGLYLPHLRTSVYKNLLEAEVLSGIDSGLDDGAAVEVRDVDADDHEEAVIRSRDLNLFISPFNGGALFELDFKPAAVNLSNTLSRWFEGYHYKLEESVENNSADGTKSIHDIVKVKEKGLEKYLKYDKNRRASFIDHFIGKDDGIDAFYGNFHNELGDFAYKRYGAAPNARGVLLSRSAKAGGCELSIDKEIKIESPNSFSVSYKLFTAGDCNGAEDLRFGVELNLLLPCCDGPACRYESDAKLLDKGLGSQGEETGIKTLGLIDTYTGITAGIEIDTQATLWRFPVHTVSLSEGGFEKIYQGSCLVFLFPVSFSNGEMELNFRVTVDKI